MQALVHISNKVIETCWKTVVADIWLVFDHLNLKCFHLALFCGQNDNVNSIEECLIR
jgi:hypothetical protein